MKQSSLEKAKVSPWLHCQDLRWGQRLGGGSSWIPSSGKQGRPPGCPGLAHGLEWEGARGQGPPSVWFSERTDEAEPEAESARTQEAPPNSGSLGPQVTWSPDVGLPPSFSAGEGGPEAGICPLFQLEGSAKATGMGEGRYSTQAQRPHSRPSGQKTASPLGHHGKVPLFWRHLKVFGWGEDSLQSPKAHPGTGWRHACRLGAGS